MWNIYSRHRVSAICDERLNKECGRFFCYKEYNRKLFSDTMIHLASVIIFSSHNAVYLYLTLVWFTVSSGVV